MGSKTMGTITKFIKETNTSHYKKQHKTDNKHKKDNSSSNNAETPNNSEDDTSWENFCKEEDEHQKQLKLNIEHWEERSTHRCLKLQSTNPNNTKTDTKNGDNISRAIHERPQEKHWSYENNQYSSANETVKIYKGSEIIPFYTFKGNWNRTIITTDDNLY